VQSTRVTWPSVVTLVILPVLGCPKKVLAY
jgi:hypothetical protein